MYSVSSCASYSHCNRAAKDQSYNEHFVMRIAYFQAESFCKRIHSICARWIFLPSHYDPTSFTILQICYVCLSPHSFVINFG